MTTLNTYLVSIHKHKVKEYSCPDKLIDNYKDYLVNYNGGNMLCALEAHGKYRQLHLHAICIRRYSRMHIKFPGYRVYHKRIKQKDFKKVYQYVQKIVKDYPTQEQVLYENECRYHNMFQ